MTKKEIVRQISERADLTQLKVKEIVQWTFDAIIKTLIEDGRIELRNFGVFEVKRRKARKARNPRTDEKVFVPEKNVVTFQPGKEMEEEVRTKAKVHEPKRKTKAETAPKPKKAKAAAETAKAAPKPKAAAKGKKPAPLATEIPPEPLTPSEPIINDTPPPVDDNQSQAPAA